MGIGKSIGGDKKRWIMSIRTTADGRRRLVEAAEQSGRNLTEEIESRLQFSFHRDDSVGGPANAAFIDLVGATLRDIEAAAGRSWRDDPETWSRARASILQLLDERAPNHRTSRGIPGPQEVE